MIDLLGAAYDFVLECAAWSGSPLDKACVYRAWPNRASLPSGLNEYAVVTALTLVRRGEPIQESALDERLIVRALYVADVQVDFWSVDGRCFKRALALEALSRTERGVSFMRERQASLLGCVGGVRDLSMAVDSDQFVRRAMTTMQIEFWSSFQAEEWSTPGPLRFKYFENVDEHHPPTGDK